MKRVIDGVTYNTDTATLIARAEEDRDFNQYSNEPAVSLEIGLYQTRGGAFFLHTSTETSRQNAEGEWRDVVRNEFEPLTASEARHWIANSQYQVEVITDVFGEPPEAAVEDTAGATLYIRIPASLKEQIETTAETEKLSVNSWVMRCMESCLVSRKSGGGITSVPRIGSEGGGIV
jgi:predicted HicB family RNase H-like nuclease